MEVERCGIRQHSAATGEENAHTARPGIKSTTSRIPCKHSDHWATERHGRPVKISPCLIRFTPKSAQNLVRQVSPQNDFFFWSMGLCFIKQDPSQKKICFVGWLVGLLGTDETVPLLLDPHWPPNATGEEKAHGPTGTRIQDLLHTVQALWPNHWPTEPLSRTVTHVHVL